MDYEEHKKIKEGLTGFEDQEILIDMMSASISTISGMLKETVKMYITQALQDALEKRNVKFKDVKFVSQKEKSEFVSDVVIGTVKQATLISSVDEIIVECNKTYNEWKMKFRPEEMKGKI